jgi:excisionase family DNA binding protein
MTRRGALQRLIRRLEISSIMPRRSRVRQPAEEPGKVVAALNAGKAVTIAPQTVKLTTQQAADLLGVSRPTVVRLITDDALPAERIGNRHRLLLDDVLAYREQRRNRQYEALAATAVDIDAEDDPEVVRQQLREARRVVAERRRAKAATR